MTLVPCKEKKQVVTTKQSKIYVMLTLVANALIQENFNKFLDLHIFSWVKIFSNCWEEFMSTICSRHDARHIVYNVSLLWTKQAIFTLIKQLKSSNFNRVFRHLPQSKFRIDKFSEQNNNTFGQPNKDRITQRTEFMAFMRC